MDLNLDNKVFVISGSSRGIGKGIAKVLAGEGAKVLITGRTEHDVINTAEEFIKVFPDKVLYHCGDLSDGKVLKEVETKVIDHWRKIDGIVANAGAVKPGPVEDILKEHWTWYLNSNLDIAVRFVQHFIEHVKKHSGSIVFISSIAGIEDVGAPIPYNVSKAALNVYSKSLATRLGTSGIRVNTVTPGNIVFPGGNWETKREANPESVDKMLNEKVPLQSFGHPVDIGNAVAFLLSDKAKFITGSNIVVDGGQTNSFR